MFFIIRRSGLMLVNSCFSLLIFIFCCSSEIQMYKLTNLIESEACNCCCCTKMIVITHEDSSEQIKELEIQLEELNE